MVLICISLMISDVEHLFICLLAIALWHTEEPECTDSYVVIVGVSKIRGPKTACGLDGIIHELQQLSASDKALWPNRDITEGPIHHSVYLSWQDMPNT